MIVIESEEDLRARLAALGDMDDNTRNAVACSLVGHSRIQEYCLGYFTCGRCGAQVGDSLGAAYDATGVVIVGHNCPKCHANASALTWRDRVFAKDPFPAPEASA